MGGLDLPPSEGAGQLLGWEGGFRLAAGRGLGIQPIVIQDLGFLQPRVCELKEPQVLTAGGGKMSSLMWLVRTPHVLPWAPCQPFSPLTPSAEFSCFLGSFVPQALSSSS